MQTVNDPLQIVEEKQGIFQPSKDLGYVDNPALEVEFGSKNIFAKVHRGQMHFLKFLDLLDFLNEYVKVLDILPVLTEELLRLDGSIHLHATAIKLHVANKSGKTGSSFLLTRYLQILMLRLRTIGFLQLLNQKELHRKMAAHPFSIHLLQAKHRQYKAPLQKIQPFQNVFQVREYVQQDDLQHHPLYFSFGRRQSLSSHFLLESLRIYGDSALELLQRVDHGHSDLHPS